MVLNESGGTDGFVINPYVHNIIFNKDMVHELKNEKEKRAKGGVIEQVIEKDTTVQLGQPRIYPNEMVAAISDSLGKRKNVSAAYLQLMIKDEEQSYLIIVDFKGDRREIFDEIGSVARKYLNGMVIELVPYDSDFGRKASNNIEPFYKKKFGLFK